MGEITREVITSSSPLPTSRCGSDPTCLGGPIGGNIPTTQPVKYPPIEYSYDVPPTPIAQPPAPAPAPFTNPVGAPVIDPSLPISSSSPDLSFSSLVNNPLDSASSALGGLFGAILGGSSPEAQGGQGGLIGGNFGDFQSYQQQLDRSASGGGSSMFPVVAIVGIGIVAYFIYSRWN